MREASAGDRAAQAILFRRVAAAYRVLGFDDEIDDVVQESFARAFASLASLREPERFGTWLSTITVGTAVNVVRKRRVRRAVALFWAEGSGVDRWMMQRPEQDAAVELRIVERLLMSLEAEERQVLILRHWDGLTLRQIAAHTGCSLATVKRRSARADAAVAQRFTPDGARGTHGVVSLDEQQRSARAPSAGDPDHAS